MQLYALDSRGAPCFVKQANRTLTYTCPECSYPLKIRGGPSKQLHFYHPAAPSACRQKEKSQEHIQTQLYLYHLLPDSKMEAPLAHRIADLFFPEQKLIFEVQCSPISLQEAQERTLDYEAMGYRILWILHDKRFNRTRLSPSEVFLRSCGAYYTNIDKDGNGMIYDQFEVLHKGRRLFKGPKLLLDPLHPLNPAQIDAPTLPALLQQRCSSWKTTLSGDLLSRFEKEQLHPFLNLERIFLDKRSSPSISLFTLLKRIYRHLLSLLISGR